MPRFLWVPVSSLQMAHRAKPAQICPCWEISFHLTIRPAGRNGFSHLHLRQTANQLGLDRKHGASGKQRAGTSLMSQCDHLVASPKQGCRCMFNADDLRNLHGAPEPCKERTCRWGIFASDQPICLPELSVCFRGVARWLKLLNRRSGKTRTRFRTRRRSLNELLFEQEMAAPYCCLVSAVCSRVGRRQPARQSESFC